jgi:3-oxoacyl-[acyl-carrier protein] reductase
MPLPPAVITATLSIPPSVRFALALARGSVSLGPDEREDMAMRLEGKTAIVTGAASGFGAGIARAFAAEGARVMVADIDAEAAEAVAAEIGGLAQAVDVSQDASVRAMAEAADAAFGRLDILVNNAGITHLPAPMEEVSEDDFDRVLAVNAKSVYLTARHVVPRMKAAHAGAILNVASTAGLSPRPRLSWYNASKGWMITATKTMAVELAPAGVRVNAICPVAGETPLLKSFMGEDTPEMRAKFLSTIPLGRFSTPADMGAAALFLCSDEAAMITGVALEVDGGRCI